MLNAKKCYNTPNLKVLGKVTLVTQNQDLSSTNDGGAPGPHFTS